ncbi:MAG: malectin domain-containing carbohydrate-binding protein [Cyclobacteriaceae bacterium]
MKYSKRFAFIVFPLFFFACNKPSDQEVRQIVSLNQGWRTVFSPDSLANPNFFKEDLVTTDWKSANVPHNWDQYEGYRRLQHGNLHGYAWYRKTFEVEKQPPGRRYFLFFEGVGSYATVFLNGSKVGYHAGGRTTFTIDITDFVNLDEENLLAVRADHPSFIEDLPWVCGGCSTEYGFSEGSQPLGIFRPVQLVVTDEIRIEPFGIHVWNDTTVTENEATINVSVEVKNYSKQSKRITIKSKLVDQSGNPLTMAEATHSVEAGETKIVGQAPPAFQDVELWSVENPYLYELVTEIYEGEELVDKEVTPCGIRWIKWDIAEGGSNQFYLNGKPIFINGTAEYEHNMGQSHAFHDKMVKARVSQMRAAGFNAFRDAHQPHNFRYHNAWDSLGMLWWTQMAAHIWYDTPEFKGNFKTLMRDWVKERRNSPSIILWGLENESTLPTEFAQECTNIIREMDPTSPSQRLVTTCNGGTGTDWNVPQNWTGTYGGNPDLYHQDVERQQLIGEFGAWRTLDFHTEGGFDQNGPQSEDRMALLMEKKVWLADSVKDKTCGHFQWIFTSHENPGRNQSGEALRELDRVGPINYKGLLSPWGEPADVFYMFRSNYAPKKTGPMVYIVSHTWPNRWSSGGIKDGISVYSNCDEVELFNGDVSLGRKANPGLGQHFVWNNVAVETNLLLVKGFVNGKEVAKDLIALNHLPESPELAKMQSADVELSNGPKNYLYRVNCGGPDYVDSNGNLWSADVNQSNPDQSGSTSWTDDFDDMPPFYASQRRTFDPVLNTLDETLFQTFRYGMDKLKFHFPLPDGKYEVELHFIEPWYGTGGGLDCEDWRVFDVAVNGKTVMDDLDIWMEANHDQALVKTVSVEVKGGELVIHFPEIKSGQAIISGIAISSNENIKPAKFSPKTIEVLSGGKLETWLDWGSKAFSDLDATVQELPSELFGADWVQSSEAGVVEIQLNEEVDIYVAISGFKETPSWLADFDFTKMSLELAPSKLGKFGIFKLRKEAGTTMKLGEEHADYRFLIMSQLATRLEPPFDLKPKVPYNEDVAILRSKGLVIDKKYQFGCVTFLNSNKNMVDWPIKTGVADYHAIHFKFNNETGKDIKLAYKLIAADLTLMETQEIVFHETPDTKYREITVSTNSMINAGDYFVRVEGEGAKGLSVRGIRVQ